MSKLSHWFLCLVMLVSLAAVQPESIARAGLPVSAPAQTASSPSSLALGSFLNSDGTLSLPQGFSGSLNGAGWKMSLGKDGRPRFAPAAPSQPKVACRLDGHVN